MKVRVIREIKIAEGSHLTLPPPMEVVRLKSALPAGANSYLPAEAGGAWDENLPSDGRHMECGLAEEADSKARSDRTPSCEYLGRDQ